MLTPSPGGWRCRKRCPCAHPGWRPWGWQLGLGDAPIDTFRCPTPNSTWARLVRRLGAAREEEMGCPGVTSALVLPRGPPWVGGPIRPPPGRVVWDPSAVSPVASPVKPALCARWGFSLLPPEAKYCPKTHMGGPAPSAGNSLGPDGAQPRWGAKLLWSPRATQKHQGTKSVPKTS